MTTLDLIQRLRKHGARGFVIGKEAADELEQLQSCDEVKSEQLRIAVESRDDTWAKLVECRAELERLRAQVAATNKQSLTVQQSEPSRSERLRAQVAEPFWYAVVSERAPVINATYRREDVALERLAKIQEERPDITDAEVVPLYRAAPSLTVGERLTYEQAYTIGQANGVSSAVVMSIASALALAAQAEPVAWPSGIDIADEIDELLPNSMGYSTRAKVEQWWRDLVARKLRQLAQVEPVRMTGTMPVRINGLEFSAPWELLTQPVFGYHFEPIAEPAAVVGSGYQLLWTGGEDFAAHAKKHGITVGTLLYTGPQSNPPAQGVEATDGAEPCPFCGSVVLAREGFHMTCIRCGADGPDGDWADEVAATAAWNRRARDLAADSITTTPTA